METKKSKLASLLRSPHKSSSTTHYGPSTFTPQQSNGVSHHEAIQKAEQDFRGYLHEKRRLYLIQLVDALNLGAEVYVKEERGRQEHEFLSNFLPLLIKYFSQKLFSEARRLLSHPPEEESQDVDGENDFETKAYRDSLQIQIQRFLVSFEWKLRRHLGSHRKTLQATAMDQLSTVVLERERFWRDKTAKDVENFHNIKLYEALLAQQFSSPVNQTSPPLSPAITTASAPAHVIKLRDLTSENILRRVSFAVNKPPAVVSPPLPSSVPSSKSERNPAHARSIEEYYAQAYRVRTKLLERITILLHEVRRLPLLGERTENESLVAESSSRSGDILDRLRGEYLERPVPVSGRSGGGGVSRKSKALSERAREGREEAYRVLSEIRSMNLQAEMFHQRQLGLQMSLRIELNALSSQLKVQQQQQQSAVSRIDGKGGRREGSI